MINRIYQVSWEPLCRPLGQTNLCEYQGTAWTSDEKVSSLLSQLACPEVGRYLASQSLSCG